MGEQELQFKGDIMEEKLRIYFLSNGYYVVRGVKYQYKGFDITDIDLFLFSKISSLSRERVNVDIKNKRSPKAFERILWTKGLQQFLNFDKCVIATTDKKDILREYGNKHNVLILDGNFLNKLTYKIEERYTEEEFLKILSSFVSFKTFRNMDWSKIYEDSKSRLLDELDFSGFNSNLIVLRYFINKCFDIQKKETAIRCCYILLSHSLIMLDYLIKDIAFLEITLRQEILSDGFNFGNLGRDGVNRTIEMAVKIANSKTSASIIKKSIDTSESKILTEYFSKGEVTKNLFKWAIELEKLAFSKSFIKPNDLETSIKATFSIFLDHYKINRKEFFGL